MSTTEHFLIPHYDPPVYGDRPEPWRRYATCSCGAELWEEEEGRGGTPGTADDALEAHIAEETGTCGCGADLTEEACPNSPDLCVGCCEEDHDADAPDTLRHCDLPSCNAEPDDAADRQRAAAEQYPDHATDTAHETGMEGFIIGAEWERARQHRP